MKESENSSVDKELMLKRRVVVTGIGMVTPLGLNVKTTWEKIKAGESGISSIEIPYTQIKVAGRIAGFNPEVALAGFVRQKDLRRISRPAQLSTAAAIEAVKNAGLFNEEAKLNDGFDPDRIGVVIGTGIGGANLLPEVAEKIKRGYEKLKMNEIITREDRVAAFDTLTTEPERVASVVSINLGLRGPLLMPSAACATGNVAITLGYKDIFMNDADIMLVGGAESTIDFLILDLFDAAGTLSHEIDKAKASRPFDKNRNGFVMSEGAAVLILEEREHAKKRGAKILAELVGYGNSADASSDTDPSGEGAERALRVAIKRAGGLPKKGFAYFNAHATSTIKDVVELGAIRNVVGDHKDFAVSSTKGATGHCMAAAGAIEAAFGVLSLVEGVLPPTIKLDHPADETEGVNMVPNETQLKQPDMVIKNCFGFGGFNSVTIFKKEE